MPSTFTNNAGIQKPGDGEQSGTWGQTVNVNMDIVDRLTMGVGTISLTGYGPALPYSLTTADGSLSEGQYTALIFAGSPSGNLTVNVTPNDAQHVYVVKNNSGVTVTMAQGSGSTVAVANGKSAMVYCTGAGVSAAVVDISATFNLTGTLQSANNLSDVSSVSTARANLGLAIGTNVLAYDANLQAFVNAFSLPTTDGTASQVLGTNGAGTLSFITVSGGGGGTVTSVDVSGGTTGLTTSGGPIVGSGTITIAGTLNLANGGTGATTQSGARTALGLGTMATQASNSVSITGGSVTGITDLAIADGGTGASDAGTARTNLGLAIGTNVQAYDADLAAIAGLSSAGILVRTGAGTAATRSLTAGSGISITNADGISAAPTITADSVQIMHVVDEQPASASSGTATAGSYVTRTLNTVVTNTITGAALTGNSIILPAGTYKVFAQVPSYRADGHIAKFRRTSGTDLIIGTVGYSGAGSSNANSYSYISGQVVAATSITCDIQQRVELTRASDGYGAPVSTLWEPKRFTQVFIQKVD